MENEIAWLVSQDLGEWEVEISSQIKAYSWGP